MEQLDIIVIGAGQSGLAVGYHLRNTSARLAILDAHERIGDTWRNRWESLRLFTPGRFSALPGSPSPAGRSGFAGKDEIAAYLEDYASRFNLPVRTGVVVSRVAAVAGGFEVSTDAGDLYARSVVCAAGHNAVPQVPKFSRNLHESISQMHSADYRGPGSIGEGTVLVVGAGTSGAEIALELSADHTVLLAGRSTPHIPDALFRYAGGLYWLIVQRLLTTATMPGRRVAAVFGRRGAPLIRISMAQVAAAGVRRLPRITHAVGGAPATDEETVPSVDTVIWATGFRPDLSWLPQLEVDDIGIPVTRRGVVSDIPGLYFMGMPFQYSLTSGLLGGAGRDAAYIVDRIFERASATALSS
ncbi:flavin-containing monooxygenase [Brevibacterium zhoupengii]|uniref:flavin-containing monooxygenase n=1 Tax=Brevibacterium zhoupengii TaxID=2898795 RepID=UPI001E4259E8|nr:NAD(P)-binding domain-containing protein [Brevibacterium zhoupengii]